VNKISVVVNAQNVEKDLPRALASVKRFADEIVVVNQESTDKTVDIAKKFGAEIFDHKKVEYVELARNFAISKATGDWIFILDPDEEVPESLAKKIKEIVNSSKADYYRIPRKNIVFNKWLKYSRWWPDYNVRLFKKGSVTWNEVIHAVPMTQGKGSEIEDREDFAIIHHHYDSIEQYLERMNRYTSEQAKMKIAEGYKISWKDLLGKPADEFFSRYYFGEGYKDGIHGLALSLLQAFSELVFYLKVWQNEKFVEEKVELSKVVSEMRSKEKELHYWQNDASYKESGRFTDRIKRKLRI
jgi:(heptosyl)LPS beta-1,4-glucosyltransferase